MAKKSKGTTPIIPPTTPEVAPITLDTTSKLMVLHAALNFVRATPRFTSPEVADTTVRTARVSLPEGMRDTIPAANTCRFTGLPVAVAQNALFAINETDGWGFTDEVLSVAWALMFPANHTRIAKGAGFTSDSAKYIGGTRSLYNHGRHGVNPADLPFRPAQGRAARPAPKDETANAVLADMVSTTDATIAAA